MNGASWARFLLLASLWGCSFAFIKVSLSAFAPDQIAMGRLLVGAVVVVSVLLFKRIAVPKRAIWGHIVVASIFGNVLPFLLFAIGEQYTTAAIAGVIQGATPLVTLGIATLAITTEKASARKVIGLLIGFIGLVTVVGPWEAEGVGSIVGQLACVGAAASYAVSFVYVRRFIAPQKVPALAVTAGQLTSASALCAVVITFFSGWIPSGELAVGPVLSLFALGGASTGLAFVLLNRLIADAGATSASAVNYLVPLVSVIVGALFLSEPITWNVFLGGAVVVLGLAVAEGKVRALVQQSTSIPTNVEDKEEQRNAPAAHEVHAQPTPQRRSDIRSG